MKLVVIGGTGFVGSCVVDEALARRHAVTLLSRRAGDVAPRDGLRPVQADVYVPETLVPVLTGHDVVVGAFNAGRENPNLYHDYVRGTRSIVASVKRAGVPRLLWVGAAGSLHAGPGVSLVDAPDFPAERRAGALAGREALRLLESERDLNWTLISPAVEVSDGPRTALYRTGADTPVVGAHGVSRISVRDLAVAILDEVERPQHPRHRFTVGY